MTFHQTTRRDIHIILPLSLVRRSCITSTLCLHPKGKKKAKRQRTLYRESTHKSRYEKYEFFTEQIVEFQLDVRQLGIASLFGLERRWLRVELRCFAVLVGGGYLKRCEQVVSERTKDIGLQIELYRSSIPLLLLRVSLIEIHAHPRTLFSTPTPTPTVLHLPKAIGCEAAALCKVVSSASCSCEVCGSKVIHLHRKVRQASPYAIFSYSCSVAFRATNSRTLLRATLAASSGCSSTHFTIIAMEAMPSCFSPFSAPFASVAMSAPTFSSSVKASQTTLPRLEEQMVVAERSVAAVAEEAVLGMARAMPRIGNARRVSANFILRMVLQGSPGAERILWC